MLLADFRPRLVLTALRQVRTEHPNLGTEVSDPSPDLLKRLRAALAQTTTTDGLQALARNLTSAELRCVVYLVAVAPEGVIRERASTVADLRRRRDLLRLGWRLLVEHCPNSELEQFVRRLISGFGVDPICAGPYQQGRIEAWFAAPHLAEGVRRDFEQLAARDLDAWLATVGVPERSGLAGTAWVDVLTRGSSGLLDRMQADVLVSRAVSRPTAVQEAFGRNYLTVLGARDRWKDVVLKWIRRQFGVPGKGDHQVPFWRGVPADIRDDFRRWVQEQTLFDFFRAHGDTAGRFQFWRRFSAHWTDVYTAVDNRVMVMDFGGLGVVEFAEVGNAAYVYDAKDFEAVLSDNPRYIVDFKNLTRARDRILHFEGWQHRAGPRFTSLLKEAGRHR